MEVELADVVLAYLDFLEARGELDLEAATEFLVLIAALLELKSRLLLPARGRGAAGPRARRGGRGAARADARGQALPRGRRAPRAAGSAAEHGRALPQRAAARASCASVDLRGVRGGLRPRAARGGRSAGCCACRRRSASRHLDDPARHGRRAPAPPARPAAPRHHDLRRGGAGRRPRDGLRDAVRAARALQAGRGRLGPGRAVRRDHDRAAPRRPSAAARMSA